MTSLALEVQHNAEKLRMAHDAVLRLSPPRVSAKSIDLWKSRTILWNKLLGTVPLFSTREAAWQSILNLMDPANQPRSGNTIRFWGVDMEYMIARHLSLTAYMTTTWSIYDRLTNCCGRIAAISKVGEAHNQNPKLCENILDSKDTLGFACHQHIIESFGWPIQVSYRIRNWLVHEGYEEGSVEMFENPGWEDGFIIKVQAAESVERRCRLAPSQHTRISALEDKWPTRNLAEILPQYHTVIDELFRALLPWSVESLANQIRLFCPS